MSSGSIGSDSQGNIYTIIESNLTKWNQKGTKLWSVEDPSSVFYSLETSPDGSIYTAEFNQLGAYSGNTAIIKYSENGEEQWSYRPRVDYTEDWAEFVYVTDIETDPQGSVYLLLYYAYINQEMNIHKLSPDGSRILDMTISQSNEENQWEVDIIEDFCVPGNSYIYAISTNWSSSGYRYILRTYYDDTYYTPSAMLYYFLLVVGVAGLVMVLIAIDRFYFAKKQ